MSYFDYWKIALPLCEKSTYFKGIAAIITLLPTNQSFH